MQRAVESAERADDKESAASYEAEAARREALVGNTSLARQQAQAAVALSEGRGVEAVSAIALGLAGDSARAMRLANNLDGRFPKDTTVQSEHPSTIRAASGLGGAGASRGADKAIEALVAARPSELGAACQSVGFALYPAYLRGEAYLATQQGPAAAAEFQKIPDHPSVVLNEP
jgi:hypothetical protein